MSTTIAPTTRAAASATEPLVAVRWNRVAERLWAGTHDGEFFGTIEFTGGAFEVSDDRGLYLGRAHSLAAAKRIIDQPDQQEPAVLEWRDGRRVMMFGWIGFVSAAVAAVTIATQLFI
ncbi:hypothetical protein [Homoserinibacter sp. GY 40078]|uniref:hypothetical protein n=1 Tax=Homoserinibacter sp. GY 40078 TaxID=2603275 RepID=UPI0011CAF53E|nr:hypothetical protein [Homoserinibacter sp. GY 40078]TXK19072.1 hypothetical protein FVQ89_03885 [Homoserinibacter sp. GY 40078]